MVQKCITDLDVDYVSLDALIKGLGHLKAEYGTGEFRKYSEPYSDYESIGFFIEVPETDSEMAQRLQQEKLYADMREEHEKKEFARLQAKFGGDKA